MNRSRTVFSVLLAIGMMVAYAYAGEGSKCTRGTSAADAAAAKCHGEAKAGVACAKDAKGCEAWATKVVYRVGEFKTCCAQKAAEAAKTNGGKIEYLVDDNVYATEGEAKVALAEKLEAALNEMLTVRYAVGDKCVACPMAAQQLAKGAGKCVKYRAVGRDFDSQDAAEAAVLKAKAAVDAVPWTCEAKGMTAASVACGQKAAMAKATTAAKGECSKSAQTAQAMTGAGCGKMATVAAKDCDPSKCPESCKVDARLATVQAKCQAALASLGANEDTGSAES